MVGDRHGRNNMNESRERLKLRAELINQNLDYLVESINEIKEIIYKTIKSGNKIMFCGNGGSAAESQHMAAEYCATLNSKNFRTGFPAIALTVDTSFITAWTNDFGYKEVFSRQVETLGDDGDTLICYSTSGKSENIIAAIQKANTISAKVILFTGNNRQIEISNLCDFVFHAPSDKTANIQEIHTLVGHEVCLAVEESLYQS